MIVLLCGLFFIIAKDISDAYRSCRQTACFTMAAMGALWSEAREHTSSEKHKIHSSLYSNIVFSRSCAYECIHFIAFITTINISFY